jgi:hypothetical protein
MEVVKDVADSCVGGEFGGEWDGDTFGGGNGLAVGDMNGWSGSGAVDV